MLTRKSDSEILHDVLEELKWDPRIRETDVGVEVDRGIVTLTGTVETYTQLLAARQAAHRVAGVLDVADNVKVRIPTDRTRTDTDIAQAVRWSLEWEAVVPDQRIQSTVADGVVTLTGSVEFPYERDAAVGAVEGLVGVAGVVNLITIVASPIQPATIKAEIENALERRAERTAETIHVEVRNGVAILHGSVHSWPERDVVVGAARSTRGVQAVEDQLTIRP